MSCHKFSLASRYPLSSIAFLCVLSQNVLGNVTYSLVDGGGGNQNGHSLSGFIEFDSACGKECTIASVLDFSFIVDGPVFNISYSYSSPDDIMDGGNGLAHINAENSTLTVDYDVAGQFTLAESFLENPGIQWNSFGLNEGVYSSIGLLGSPWTNSGLSGDATIGTVVPEPASLVLLGLAVCFLNAGRSKGHK